MIYDEYESQANKSKFEFQSPDWTAPDTSTVHMSAEV